MSQPLDPPPLRAPWHRRPYLHLGLSILFSTLAQPLLKHGVDQVHAAMPGLPYWRVALIWISNPWVVSGILAIIVSLLSWLHALRTVPLNIAFNLSGVTHVLVPLCSLLFLGEHVSGLRWLGILLVAAGVVITAKEAVRLEEKL